MHTDTHTHTRTRTHTRTHTCTAARACPGIKTILGTNFFSASSELQDSDGYIYSEFRPIIRLFDSQWSARNNLTRTSIPSIRTHALNAHWRHINTLALTHTGCAEQMSAAPMSVLNCNGPCQIKGKVFYVLRQTQLIFHQAWIHRPHWSSANLLVCVCVHVYECMCVSTFIRYLAYLIMCGLIAFDQPRMFHNHVLIAVAHTQIIVKHTHAETFVLCESGWKTSRGAWVAESFFRGR